MSISPSTKTTALNSTASRSDWFNMAIYLVGFTLNKALPKVVKVQRRYLNGVTEQALPAGTREAFVEMLTHDAVIVQIPLLDSTADTALERALSVFDQKLKDKIDGHYLVLSEEESKAPLVEKMTRALLMVAANEETKHEMGMEDELASILEQAANAEARAEAATYAALKTASDALQPKEEGLRRIAALEKKLRQLGSKQ